MIEQTKRVNYFNGQFLRAQDFQDEQKYHLDHRWGHNKAFYSAGVAEGLAVTPTSNNQVIVEPGWALDEEGRELVLPAKQPLTLSGAAGHSVAICIAYPDPEVLSDPSTDPSTDPSVTSFTRIDGRALLIRVPGDADTRPPQSLLLATVNIETGGALALEDKRTWAGITTDHIQDNAITDEKIADGTIDETKLNVAAQQKLNAGIRGWVRSPFFPNGFPRINEFQIKGTTAASGSGGASGFIAIQIPLGATALTGFRISGNLTAGEILIQLFLGTATSDATLLLTEAFNDTGPFNIQPTVNQTLTTDNCLGLTVTATNASVIRLVAAEFEITT
jgi:hypothetical protein